MADGQMVSISVCARLGDGRVGAGRSGTCLPAGNGCSSMGRMGFAWPLGGCGSTAACSRGSRPISLHRQVGTLRVAVAGELQGFLDLGQQIVVEERPDLGRLQVHDAVQPEVEVATVELKHLAQQRAEAVEVLPGAGGVRIQRGHGRSSFAGPSSVEVVRPVL